GGVEVELEEIQLRRDQHADQHADRTPENGGEHELADNTVIVFDRDGTGGHGRKSEIGKKRVRVTLRSAGDIGTIAASIAVRVVRMATGAAAESPARFAPAKLENDRAGLTLPLLR